MRRLRPLHLEDCLEILPTQAICLEEINRLPRLLLVDYLEAKGQRRIAVHKSLSLGLHPHLGQALVLDYLVVVLEPRRLQQVASSRTSHLLRLRQLQQAQGFLVVVPPQHHRRVVYSEIQQVNLLQISSEGTRPRHQPPAVSLGTSRHLRRHRHQQHLEDYSAKHQLTKVRRLRL